MQDPRTLEPANGDYVTYLEKLLSGKERKLEPLSISAADGMVKVQSAAEVQADAAARQAEVDAWRAQRREKQLAATAKLGAVFGSILAAAGVLSIVTGIIEPELEHVCIPLGMITVFAGTVIAGRSKSAARRR